MSDRKKKKTTRKRDAVEGDSYFFLARVHPKSRFKKGDHLGYNDFNEEQIRQINLKGLTLRREHNRKLPLGRVFACLNGPEGDKIIAGEIPLQDPVNAYVVQHEMIPGKKMGISMAHLFLEEYQDNGNRHTLKCPTEISIVSKPNRKNCHILYGCNGKDLKRMHSTYIAKRQMHQRVKGLYHMLTSTSDMASNAEKAPPAAPGAEETAAASKETPTDASTTKPTASPDTAPETSSVPSLNEIKDLTTEELQQLFLVALQDIDRRKKREKDLDVREKSMKEDLEKQLEKNMATILEAVRERGGDVESLQTLMDGRIHTSNPSVKQLEEENRFVFEVAANSAFSAAAIHQKDAEIERLRSKWSRGDAKGSNDESLYQRLHKEIREQDDHDPQHPRKRFAEENLQRAETPPQKKKAPASPETREIPVPTPGSALHRMANNDPADYVRFMNDTAMPMKTLEDFMDRLREPPAKH